jgi:hypothetical protein
MSNLLSGVEGRLPGDKEKMLQVIDAYLQKPEPERLAFRLRQWRSFLAVWLLPEPLEQRLSGLGRSAPGGPGPGWTAIAFKEGFVC